MNLILIISIYINLDTIHLFFMYYLYPSNSLHLLFFSIPLLHLQSVLITRSFSHHSFILILFLDPMSFLNCLQLLYHFLIHSNLTIFSSLFSYFITNSLTFYYTFVDSNSVSTFVYSYNNFFCSTVFYS